MKRILAMLLAIILLLSCCPNVYATEAEEELGYSELFANMDPKIKEMIDSQISQEERDALVALDSSLSDALLLKVHYFRRVLAAEDPMEAIFTAINKTGFPDPIEPKLHSVCSDYYLLSDKPQAITYIVDAFTGTPKLEKRELVGKWQFIKDIMAFDTQVEIGGKREEICGIYCFGQTYNQADSGNGTTICLMTNGDTSFYFYPNNPRYSIFPPEEVMFLSESEFEKYITDYMWYCWTLCEKSGDLYDRDFGSFVKIYDYCMREARATIIEMGIAPIKQAFSTYGPIGLGVVVVGGAVAIFVICRKRKKLALAAEIAPDATEPIPDTIDSIVDTSDG